MAADFRLRKKSEVKSNDPFTQLMPRGNGFLEKDDATYAMRFIQTQ